jgi:NADPH:quinone reductase-like Zn-dependent oxidoreductase
MRCSAPPRAPSPSTPSAPESKLTPKQATLTFEQAAVVAVPGQTALQGLRDHGRVEPGQKVLITDASGGVGILAVQLAKTFGAQITGVCNTMKEDLVRSIGAADACQRTSDTAKEPASQRAPRSPAAAQMNQICMAPTPETYRSRADQ